MPERHISVSSIFTAVLSLAFVLLFAGCGATVEGGSESITKEKSGSLPLVPETCENGKIDSGEVCDGEALGGVTCQSLGFESGSLSCKASCTFDTSLCESDFKVTELVGTFSSGESVRIEGQGFGEHGDYHSDTDKIVQVWTDFENGGFANDYLTWGSDFGGSEVNTIASSGTRANSSYNYRKVAMGSDGVGNITTSMRDEPEFFVSMYTRIPNNFASYYSDCGQWKFTRIGSTDSSMNIYPGYSMSLGPGFTVAQEFIVPFSNNGDNQWRISAPLEGWHRWDMYVRKSESFDGAFEIYVDGQKVYDFNEDVAPLKGIAGYDTTGGNLAGTIAVGSYTKCFSGNPYVDFDDIYITYTRARVELCDSLTPDPTRRCELQIPTSWSSNAIDVDVNLGAFSSAEVEAGLYLFVVNEAGEFSAPYLLH